MRRWKVAMVITQVLVTAVSASPAGSVQANTTVPEMASTLLGQQEREVICSPSGHCWIILPDGTVIEMS